MSESEPELIRPEIPADRPAIAAIVGAAFKEAFDSTTEVDLVERLHTDGLTEIELVAEQASEIIGHIVFSRLAVVADDRILKALALALAPVAVKPGLQNRGTGGRLITAGHALAHERGFEAIFVLGHPDYYPRFGYDASAAEPFRSPFSGPHFMALALKPGALAARAGTVAYPPAFG